MTQLVVDITFDFAEFYETWVCLISEATAQKIGVGSLWPHDLVSMFRTFESEVSQRFSSLKSSRFEDSDFDKRLQVKVVLVFFNE